MTIITNPPPETHYAAAPPDPVNDWRHHAACRNHPEPELFHPVGNTGPALRQIEDAKRVCRRCPVLDSCLAFALDSKSDFGVYGGMSEDERAALKRRASRPSRTKQSKQARA